MIRHIHSITVQNPLYYTTTSGKGINKINYTTINQTEIKGRDINDINEEVKKAKEEAKEANND